jgi:uncharacterized membrane protein
MNRWTFLWRRLRDELWFRAGSYAAFGVAAALAAGMAGPFVPKEIADRFGGESVEQILTILASSLLAVATFSLGAMVTAYTAVSSAATPRVARLVTGDDSTQRSLATFVGAFLYAIVGLIAVNASYYGAEGRAVIFFTSVLVVGLVAWRLLAWINRLSSLARVGHMVELVEGRTRRAMKSMRDIPNMGGLPGPVTGGAVVTAREAGWIQNVERIRLHDLAERADIMLEVLAPPGTMTAAGQPLARTSAPVSEADAEEIRDAFEVSHTRSFDQDPRFGLEVLGEITAHALSPGINDPGTAVEVLGAGLRLMQGWGQRDAEPPSGAPPECPRLRLVPLKADDLLDDVFGPAMRYGAGDLIVALRLQETLGALADQGGETGRAAARMARAAAARSRLALTNREDRARLKAAARC